MQKGQGAVPRELRSRRIVSIWAVFLKEPMAGPRIGIEGGGAVCAAQVLLQGLDPRYGFVRIRFGEVTEEGRFGLLKVPAPAIRAIEYGDGPDPSWFLLG